MTASENVCMKVDTLGSAFVTKMGWTSSKSTRSHRGQFVQPKRDRADCRLLIVFPTLGGSKVNMEVAINGPGPAMMGEGKGSGTAHDGHISNEEERMRKLGSEAGGRYPRSKGSNRRTCLDLVWT